MNLVPPPNPGFGIYIHVPWCRARCPYCAFNVVVDAAPPHTAWQAGIQAAWRSVCADFEGRAASLYFGGGTPSLLPPDLISELIADLPLQDDAEITLEANPGTVTVEQLQAFKDAGINRVSIGVQSLEERVARRLGRGHTVQQAQQLIDAVDAVGFRTWSLDLIFAVPDQTMDELNRDLNRIRSVRPPHISLYGLTVEAGTPFFEAQQMKRLFLPPPDLWRAMYDQIVDVLETEGWLRYEVSNFALPGHESRHNEDVWRGGNYAGLGPGAHGFHADGTRTTSERDISRWLQAPQPTRCMPSGQEAATDLILTTLRHRSGLNLSQLSERTGYALPAEAIDHFIRAGFLSREHSRIRLTSNGYPLADGIVRQLCTRLEPIPS